MRCHTFCLLASLCALLLIPHEAQSKPKDIQRLSVASKVISTYVQSDESDAADRISEALVTLRLKLAKSIVKARTFGGAVDLEDKALLKALARPLMQTVKAAFNTPRISRRWELVYDALVSASSAIEVEALIASHLNFASPGSLANTKFHAAQAPFSKQVRVTSDTPRLEVLTNQSRLLMDTGGSGTGNGIIDAGEWVNLELAVVNKSPLPYFSSSAFVHSDSDCLWVPPSREFIFPELGPYRSDAKIGALRDEDLPAGRVYTWVYVSNQCRDRQQAALRLVVKDSHRTKGAQHTLRVNLTVRNRANARVVSFFVDHDIPGWSDGSGRPPIGPGRQFELSHAIKREASDFARAKMGWSISKAHTPLFTSMKFRSEEPMLTDPENAGRLLPGDDYDLETISSSQYKRRSNEIARREGWADSDDAKVLAATDVTLLYNDPHPPTASKSRMEQREVLTEVTCADGYDNDSDGLTDCADSDCTASKECLCGAKRPGPVSEDKVVALLKSVTDIKATPAAPKGKGSTKAVSVLGYELNFDDQAFRKQYECLVNNIPLSRCGIPPCPDCKKVMPPPKRSMVTVKVPATSDAPKRYVAYRVRNYFAVPIVWSPPTEAEVCNDRVDNDRDGATDCADSDCRHHSSCRRVEKRCKDGVDNDGDGAIDCADSDCAYSNLCRPKREQCTNGLDDDGDMAIDCDDTDCFKHRQCQDALPNTWLDLSFLTYFGGYESDITGAAPTDESFTTMGFRVGLSLAPARFIEPAGAGVLTRLSAWYTGASGLGMGGLSAELGYVFEATNWLEITPHAGLAVHFLSLDQLASTDIEMEPTTLGAFAMGLSIQILPFSVPFYFTLNGGLHYLAHSPTDLVQLDPDNNGLERSRRFTLSPTFGVFDVGVGYRF